MSWVLYPFTAIVDQEEMKRALLLNAVDPGIGGVLLRGERGTGKSTAARALAALLPPIRVIRDCPFHCDPGAPDSWCPWCQERHAQGEPLEEDLIPTPFVNLPLSVTEDRLVGTLDIERALKEGVWAFQPGLLASAHRGVLYIDEVNLLDDHLVDLLLDVAAMGVNVVEREGISFTHLSRFILIGSMNPEEGDLRPQLLDRFALAVDVSTVRDLEMRMRIMERHLAFRQDPAGFRAQWDAKEEALRGRILQARSRLPGVTHTPQDLEAIATLVARVQVPGHRAELAILRAARANAALEGRDALTPEDITLAAALALRHRLRRDPLEPTPEPLDWGRLVQEAYRQAQAESMWRPSETGIDVKKDLQG